MSAVPSCAIDFYGPDTIADPVTAYHKMLSLGPIVRLEPLGMTAICGHAAVTQILRDHRGFRSGKGVSVDENVNRILIGSTLNSDPPDHDRTRAITYAPLSPKALAGVRARIEKEANIIADRVVGQGEFDAAAELAPHIPLTIVRDLVGLGDGGHDHMLSWGAATFELMGDPGERRADAQARLGQMRAFLEDPQTHDRLTPDGWARQATEKGIAAGIPPARAMELMRDYIPPSLDTTISAIGFAIHLFARHPDQWHKLRADRSLIKNAIEEIVRLNTPIRAFTRHVAETTTVAGVKLTGGSRVLVVFGAANRDPAHFPDPDRFDITRTTRGHLGFGHGVHSCLGMHLARLEISCLLNALADRVTGFEATGPAIPAVNATIHAFAQVPVRAIKARS